MTPASEHTSTHCDRFVAAAQDGIARLLAGDGLDIVFQPVVLLARADVYGYEAFVRAHAPYTDPLALFAAARRAQTFTILRWAAETGWKAMHVEGPLWRARGGKR